MALVVFDVSFILFYGRLIWFVREAEQSVGVSLAVVGIKCLAKLPLLTTIGYVTSITLWPTVIRAPACGEVSTAYKVPILNLMPRQHLTTCPASTIAVFIGVS